MQPRCLSQGQPARDGKEPRVVYGGALAECARGGAEDAVPGAQGAPGWDGRVRGDAARKFGTKDEREWGLRLVFPLCLEDAAQGVSVRVVSLGAFIGAYSKKLSAA